MLRVHLILIRIRILDPHWKKMDPDPDPGHFFMLFMNFKWSQGISCWATFGLVILDLILNIFQGRVYYSENGRPSHLLSMISLRYRVSHIGFFFGVIYFQGVYFQWCKFSCVYIFRGVNFHGCIFSGVYIFRGVYFQGCIF